MNLKEHRRDVLVKLGFVEDGGTRHEKWVLKSSKSGKVYARTVVSRTNHDIGPTLRSKFCGQLNISKNQYQRIASCDMSRKEYYDHLMDNKFI